MEKETFVLNLLRKDTWVVLMEDVNTTKAPRMRLSTTNYDFKGIINPVIPAGTVMQIGVWKLKSITYDSVDMHFKIPSLKLNLAVGLDSLKYVKLQLADLDEKGKVKKTNIII